MEQVSLSRLNLLHPAIRQDAIDAYSEAVRLTPKVVHPFITQTLRSFKESDDLYQQGRTDPGSIVSNAKAGQSMHNYGFALDFVIQINGKMSWEVDKNWMIVVKCFEDRGFEWGGRWSKFKDYPHFQKSFGYSWKTLLSMHQEQEFIPGETYINLT